MYHDVDNNLTFAGFNVVEFQRLQPIVMDFLEVYAWILMFNWLCGFWSNGNLDWAFVVFTFS